VLCNKNAPEPSAIL